MIDFYLLTSYTHKHLLTVFNILQNVSEFTTLTQRTGFHYTILFLLNVS